MTSRVEERPVVQVAIRDESDVVMARKSVREVGARVGLARTEIEELATAVSEIARNVLIHAGAGLLLVEALHEEGLGGVVVEARDEGPGIENVEQAFQDGFSSAGGLGLGLSSARRLVDDLRVSSVVGRGTIVTVRKMARAAGSSNGL